VATRGPKARDRASTPAPGRPDAPSHLDPVAREFWTRVASLVESAGLISLIDAPSLEMFADLYSTYREARDKVKTGGKVITAVNGYKQINPWFHIQTQAQKDMKHYFDKFGLTPAARSKLAVEEAEPEDPKWTKFKT
jgi:P27 family predicted phage terminase small subunit